MNKNHENIYIQPGISVDILLMRTESCSCSISCQTVQTVQTLQYCHEYLTFVSIISSFLFLFYKIVRLFVNTTSTVYLSGGESRYVGFIPNRSVALFCKPQKQATISPF